MNWEVTERSLCQIPGISPDREVFLNHRGITNLRNLGSACGELFSKKQANRIRASIARFEHLIELEITDAIVSSFPCGHRVRVIQDRYASSCFLDVETDEHSHITVVSTLLDGVLETFVRGKNLDGFLDVWKRMGIVVTFNGKRFDIPVLQQEFGFTRVSAVVDLMDEARHYGCRGGLKNIEKQIGFSRVTPGVTGGDAPKLWNEFVRANDVEALNRLVCYNREDVKSLEYLFHFLVTRSLENLVFDN